MTAFEQLLASLGVRAPTVWGSPLLAACAAHEINSPLRMGALLANVFHETNNLSDLVESMNYTPQALAITWPVRFSTNPSVFAPKIPNAAALQMGRTATRPANQVAIAERAYGGRLGNGPEGSGDGYRLRGHGGLMTTGRTNLTAFGRTIGWTGTIEALTDYLTMPVGAAESAAAFFQASGCNAPADRGDIAAVRKIINGGSIGLADVHARYPVILAALQNARRATLPSAPIAAIITADDLNARELARIRSAA